MKTLLLLGGTGWLGRHVAGQAVQAGYRVTCLARGESGEFPPCTEAVRADRQQPGAYRGVQRDWDLIVDLSWQPGQVRSALRALAARTTRWVYVSSISVYANHARPGQHEGARLLAPWPADTAEVAQYGEAKVAGELLVRQTLGDRALIVRPGLIIGPGDPSDRFGYWAAAFARAHNQCVLVPHAEDQVTQGVDVRDLARWIVVAGQAGIGGAVNAVDRPRRLAEVLALSRQVAGFTGEIRQVDEGFLTTHDVAPWAGPRSLPLWLPGEEYRGFGAYANERFVRTGACLRDLSSTLGDVLADERDRGVDRVRRAGLSRAQEVELLAAAEPTRR